MYIKFGEEFYTHLRNDLDDQRRIDVREETIELVERMHDNVVKFRGKKTRRYMGDVGGYVTPL